MMAGLLHAEWIKLRRLRVTWLTPLLPTFLVFVGGIRIVNSLAESNQRYGVTLDDTILKSFAFPQLMLGGLQFASALGTLLVVIFMTAIVGNEYIFDTWKTLLTRRAGRGRFLMVKLSYALAESTLTLILVPVVFQATTLIAMRSVLNLAPPADFAPSQMASLGITFIVAWVRLAIAATIGLLATVITRSGAGGIALAAPWLLGDLLVNGLSLGNAMWQDLAPYTFNFNLAAFEAYLYGNSSDVSLVHCIAILLIYTVGFSLLAVVIFRRRDIAG
jgi:ABC-type transport system involved in multi-copper enzyme maturation permease subunit